MKSILIIIFLILLCQFQVAETVYLETVKIQEVPKIDGQLNDAVWNMAKPFTAFRMIEPETGISPSEKTEVRILYSKDNLYIGIYNYDSNPKKIIVKNLNRDSRENDSDLVRILLDPFQDKRNAYIFFINAKGALSDGLAFGEHFSLNWDGVWDAKSKIQSDGWSTEIKIPFKTIAFNPRLKSWGLNVERYIPRKQETIRLSGISKDSFFYNPAEAAFLRGIEGIKLGLGITLKPYTSLGVSNDFLIEDNTDWDLAGGFDIYKNITPNLVGAFSYHTDFAETEVDDRIINLTRFPEYYPEKRTFFLEGSEIFNFGTGMHRAFIPFFSRRIGLYEEEQIPIDFGFKLFGKINNTNLSFLDVKTRATDIMDSKNYFAGRVYQNIFSESKMGMIFTSGNPDDNTANTLLGFDFIYNTSRLWKNKNFNAGAWIVYNWNDYTEGSHLAYGFKIDYPNDLIDTAIVYTYLGDALEPGLAYLPRIGVKRLIFRFSLQPRPKNGFFGKVIRQFFFENFIMFYWDTSGSIESFRWFLTPLNVNLESGDKFEFNFIPQREVLPEEFEIVEGIIIPIDDYTFTRYRFKFQSASHRTFGLNLGYEFGDFYSGSLNQFDLGIFFRYKGNINIGLETTFINANLLEGAFEENVYRLRSDFFLNANIGIMTYIQYDNISRELGANIRFRWRISPGNTLYIVYNHNWERRFNPLSSFVSIGNAGIFKIQITWRP